MAGYIGPAPVPQATQTREAFTATASQTTFNTSGYTVGFIDVYLNGVKLAAADYTATNGSDIVLAVGAAENDILEMVAFGEFTVADQDFTGDLTVDGDTFVVDSTNDRVGIGTSSISNAKLKVSSSGAGAAIMSEDTDSTTSFVRILGDASSQNLVNWQDGTSLRFATSTQAYGSFTERMRIDSSGNVGIGTTGPSAKLDVKGSTSDQLRLRTADTEHYAIGRNASNGFLDFYGSQASYTGYTFGGVDGERMRIDSSGNLLVGTTTTNPQSSSSNSGVQIGDGFVFAGRAGEVAIFNRQTSDGDIAVFRKDGTTVGSIGASSGYMYLGDNNGATGAGLHFVNTGIRPHDAKNNSISDGEIDLGVSGARFKDLFLSGGVYLGGAVAANHLDDYEEGTWTPIISDASSGGNTATIGSSSGRYVKIGKVVHVEARCVDINNSGMTSSNLIYIQNFPFSTHVDGSMATGNIRLDRFDVGANAYSVSILLASSSNVGFIYENVDGTNDNALTVASIVSTGSDMFFSLTYQV